MRYLIILVGFSILCGCSKKTLSGVYIKKSDSLYDSYDFRTDGTVQDKYKQYFSTINDTINISRTGSYVLDGDKVVVDVIETTMDNDTVKYRDIFRTEGNDLIHILHIENYQSRTFTNIDKSQDRYVKITQ